MPISAVLTDKAPAPVGPYSQAIRAGEWLFCSGQIPLDPATGRIKGETAAEQAEAAFCNLESVLTAAGASPAAVVKTTLFLTDLNDFASVNEVYAHHFGRAGPPPARSCVEVSRLPKGVKVEVEAIAFLG